MNMSAFLYRRLAKFITCHLSLTSVKFIALRSKYDVASFSDVFCQPFYWQLYSLLEEPPEYVFDCGANCGHFTILADQCIKARFPTSETKYILVEPNPFILPTLRKNISDAGLVARATIVPGMMGAKHEANVEFWISTRNYLTASSTHFPNSRQVTTTCFSIDELLPNSSDLVMKVDIEGGEYQIQPESLQKLKSLQLLFIELHGPDESRKADFIRMCEVAGVYKLAPEIRQEPHSLYVLGQQRRTNKEVIGGTN